MRQLIEQAAAFLEGRIRKTPVELSPELSKLLGQPIYLSTLNETEKKFGVATCSAGNHCLGMAYAANELHIPCTVFVPKSVDQAKYDKLLKLGAKVKKSEFVGYDDTIHWAIEESARLHLPLVSAFNDEKIMAGNGGLWQWKCSLKFPRLHILCFLWEGAGFLLVFPGM